MIDFSYFLSFSATLLVKTATSKTLRSAALTEENSLRESLIPVIVTVLAIP
jgi:hypothetical protein